MSATTGDPGLGPDAALSARLVFSRGAGFVLRAELALSPGVSVLLGPSGAGKSTVLDLLAGHLRADAGRITAGGTVLFARRAGERPQPDVPPQARRIGYVAQGQALFPHLTVRQNLCYGLFRLPRAARRDRTESIAAELGLLPLLDRLPQTLSGGERQRVALGRALAPEPRALLLDEPLSAVDLPARAALLARLRALLGALSIPVLYVTHSAEEVAFWAGPTWELRAAADPATVEIARKT